MDIMQGEQSVKTGGMSVLGLEGRRLWVPVLAGVGLWFTAAVLIGALRGAGLMQGAALLAVYGLTTLISVVSVPLIVWAAGLVRGQTLPAIAIGLGLAMALDGLALVLASGLYGGPGPGHAEAGALILWGAAWFLAMAIWVDSK